MDGNCKKRARKNGEPVDAGLQGRQNPENGNTLNLQRILYDIRKRTGGEEASSVSGCRVLCTGKRGQLCKKTTKRGRNACGVFFCSSMKDVFFLMVMKKCCKNARSGEGKSAGDFGLKN